MNAWLNEQINQCKHMVSSFPPQPRKSKISCQESKKCEAFSFPGNHYHHQWIAGCCMSKKDQWNSFADTCLFHFFLVSSSDVTESTYYSLSTPKTAHKLVRYIKIWASESTVSEPQWTNSIRPTACIRKMTEPTERMTKKIFQMGSYSQVTQFIASLEGILTFLRD